MEESHVTDWIDQDGIDFLKIQWYEIPPLRSG